MKSEKRAETRKKLEAIVGIGGMKRDGVFLVVSLVALVLSLLPIPLPADPAWIAIVLCGIPIILDAIIGLVTEFDIKADVLVSMALIASLAIGEIFAAGEVAFIMQLGGFLEALTVAHARAGIEKLVRLTPQTARRLKDGVESVIPASEVMPDDHLRVLPGETIPVDGVIVAGQTSINQAVMTGESLPVDKEAGDEVYSGTVNQFGAFEMRATRVGEDSSIQRMIQLVQSADAGKAKIVGLADRWATWVVIIAVTAAVLTWIITGKIIRAVTILVVFCPCALVLATPTAIMAAIGNATKHGFLVKEGDALERLSKVTKVMFDKTGTLTHGVPQVVRVVSADETIPAIEVFSLCAAAERLSEHPLGKAIVHCYLKKEREEKQGKEALAEKGNQNGKAPDEAEVHFPELSFDHFEMIPGRGVKARVEGKDVMAGSLQMLSERSIPVPETLCAETERDLKEGCSVIYVSLDGKAVGLLALSDTIREESAFMMDALSEIGVQPVLLTGDNPQAAVTIAQQGHIREVHAQCRPEDKLKWIDEAGKAGDFVCMIGDGVNDAPALKKADVGIAMGGVGSDIAVDAADIALVDDEVKELPHLLALSRRMMTTIKINLIFSMTLNVIAIILAITGILNPIVGALVHNCGSVLVILHSATLLTYRWKPGRGKGTPQE